MLSTAHKPLASRFLQMCLILLFLNGTGYIWDWQTVAYGDSENQVLLEHGHTIGSHIVSGCFPSAMATLSGCGREHLAHQPKIFTTWLFSKMFANS